MGRKDKLEAKIRNNPRNVSLNDFETLVKIYGCVKEGSRHPLAIIGTRVYPYKRTNPVHSPYVLKIIELIDALKNA